MPASDMMLEVIPIQHMGMKARSTATGMVTMGTIADGMCQRKSRITSAHDDHLEDELVLRACRSRAG